MAKSSAQRFKKIVRYSLLLFMILFMFPLTVLLFGPLQLDRDWTTADQKSMRLAPEPEQFRDAIVQVYSARSWGWRGAFGVHTWIAAKRSGASSYTVYQVVGWQYYRGNKPIRVRTEIPDRKWFGNEPTVLLDLRGAHVEKIIDNVEAAVAQYPAAHYYGSWPGPNSNTFTAFVGRQVPELSLELPPTAIGKDYLVGGFLGSKFFARTPSCTGWQFSYFGLLGISLGLKEGIEFNLLALNFGIDPLDLAILLPGWGKISILDLNQPQQLEEVPLAKSAM